MCSCRIYGGGVSVVYCTVLQLFFTCIVLCTSAYSEYFFTETNMDVVSFFKISLSEPNVSHLCWGKIKLATSLSAVPASWKNKKKEILIFSYELIPVQVTGILILWFCVWMFSRILSHSSVSESYRGII